MILRGLLLLAWSALLVACDSDDDPSNGSPVLNPSSLPAFSAYCTGMLKVPYDGMLPVGPGAWMSSSFNKASLPVGTEFLLGSSFDKFEGYALLADQSPSKVEADFKTGLVKDVDFTTSCTGTTGIRVLLKRSTFYASDEFTGQPCALEAGVRMSNFSFVSNGSVATIKADEIKATCGFESGASKDVTWAELLLK